MAHATHHSLKTQGQRSHERKVAHHRAAGGKVGDKASDEKMIKKAMREHDSQQHEGKHTRLKFKEGGAVEGEASAARLDRPGRAKGGKTGKGGKTHVNVIVAPQNHTAPPMPAGPAMMPPHPMPAPPPPAAPPPPGPPGAPPGASPGPGMPPRMAGPPVGAGMPMRNTGGRVGRKDGGMIGPAEDNKMSVNKTEAGGKSGEGRLQKAAKAAKENLGESNPSVDKNQDTAARRVG